MRMDKKILISIHAPARGATEQTGSMGRDISISIHAPARGATADTEICTCGLTISIHAPARGATKILLKVMSIYLFQSTLPQGERPRYSRGNQFWAIFQSTLPQGERRSEIKANLYRTVFQSTLPQGERPLDSDGRWKYLSISIHAPARGATHWLSEQKPFLRISIHAPARGATFQKPYILIP